MALGSAQLSNEPTGSPLRTTSRDSSAQLPKWHRDHERLDDLSACLVAVDLGDHRDLDGLPIVFGGPEDLVTGCRLLPFHLEAHLDREALHDQEVGLGDPYFSVDAAIDRRPWLGNLARRERIRDRLVPAGVDRLVGSNGRWRQRGRGQRCPRHRDRRHHTRPTRQAESQAKAFSSCRLDGERRPNGSRGRVRRGPPGRAGPRRRSASRPLASAPPGPGRAVPRSRCHG